MRFGTCQRTSWQIVVWPIFFLETVSISHASLAALQLFYSKLFSIFNIKWVFLSALAIFEAGTLVCGVAKSSTVLIIGRAIAGIGCGGIFVGALLTLAHTLPLEKRPVFMGSLGGMYGVACVAGPLVRFSSL